MALAPRPRTRNPLLFPNVKPLRDDERPPKLVYWLAGGRFGPRGKVPTIAELREKRRGGRAKKSASGPRGGQQGEKVTRSTRTVQVSYEKQSQPTTASTDTGPDAVNTASGHGVKNTETTPGGEAVAAAVAGV